MKHARTCSNPKALSVHFFSPFLCEKNEEKTYESRRGTNHNFRHSSRGLFLLLPFVARNRAEYAAGRQTNNNLCLLPGYFFVFSANANLTSFLMGLEMEYKGGNSIFSQRCLVIFATFCAFVIFCTLCALAGDFNSHCFCFTHTHSNSKESIQPKRG